MDNDWHFAGCLRCKVVDGMTPKKLQPTSKYAKYDLDGDGTVTDEEIQRHQDMIELELREEKADSQKHMAWVSMASMVLFSIFLMLPIITNKNESMVGSSFIGAST